MQFTRRQALAAGLVAPALAKASEPPFVLLEPKAGTARLLPEPAAETAIRGFSGKVPGPALRIKKGEEIRARLINSLDQQTGLHWQGARIANAMDGAVNLTQKPIQPGESFDYRFTPPDSGLFWYRPSAQPYAFEQKARGLYGLLIVEETAPPLVDLDLPVVIDDWRLDEAGAINGPFPDPADLVAGGRIGALVTVNSQPMPLKMTQAPRARVRLRLLNACDARLIGVMFDNLRPLVVGIDGQACEPFEPAQLTIPVGPGARFDLIMDLPGEAGATCAVKLRGGGLRTNENGEPDRDLVVFQTEGPARAALPAIVGPPLNPLLPAVIALEKARRLDLIIEGPAKDPARRWTLNGVAGGAEAKPLFTVARGQPVSLGFINKTPVAQIAHVHGHVMRVLHLLDDGWEPYWRDAVIVPPGKTARVAFIADNPGKWLIESTILEHAAAGMSAWFAVA